MTAMMYRLKTLHGKILPKTIEVIMLGLGIAWMVIKWGWFLFFVFWLLWAFSPPGIKPSPGTYPIAGQSDPAWRYRYIQIDGHHLLMIEYGNPGDRDFAFSAVELHDGYSGR